jgi:hypothetical protein
MAIRPDTDPKSASPRSGAPKGELEQYGVWVKAEPQDVIEEVAGSGDLDFDLPGDTASLPEESLLSEDEEKLLGTFDSEFEAPSGSSADESGPLPDIEDMPPLEESLASEPALDMEEIEDIGSQSIDISLEDIESSRPSSPIHPGAEIDMQSVEGLGRPSVAEDSSSGSIEDVSSEFLDSVEESEPSSKGMRASVSDFGSGLDDVTADFLDVEEVSTVSRASESSVDFEPLDIDLQFDDSAAAGIDSRSRPAPEVAGFEAVTEFDDFLSSDGAQAASVDAGFDDISAVERELTSAPPKAAPVARPTFAAAAEKPEPSAEILQKIAQELSSIRGELASLKTQIGEVMSSVESAPKKAGDSSPEEGAESGPSGGFFDEEEDETIALTGDELDNILNTADFTEETAETEQLIEIDSDGLTLEPSSHEDRNLLDETLLPESGDYSTPDSEPAIEEVRIGQADSIDEIGLEPDELSLVIEEGIIPMTSAPDDTSYLEAVESIDIGDVSLSDEPLVEPDLSNFELEPEDLEPRLEIDEELPLASLEPDPAVEDMTLGIDAGLGYAAEESVVDAEFLEPILEIEEPNFAEINLHEEGLEASSSSEPSELEEIDAISDSDLSASLASEPLPLRSEELPIEEEEDIMLAADEEFAPAPARETPRSPAKAQSPKPVAAKGPALEPPIVGDVVPELAAADGDRLKSEIRSVLSYLDKLLDSLPEEKIEEFANSEYFDTYKKLFEELGLV